MKEDAQIKLCYLSHKANASIPVFHCCIVLPVVLFGPPADSSYFNAPCALSHAPGNEDICWKVAELASIERDHTAPAASGPGHHPCWRLRKAAAAFQNKEWSVSVSMNPWCQYTSFNREAA
eukprot:1137918-Pelagomonas_calceolata.AAC.5